MRVADLFNHKIRWRREGSSPAFWLSELLFVSCVLPLSLPSPLPFLPPFTFPPVLKVYLPVFFDVIMSFCAVFHPGFPTQPCLKERRTT